MMRLGSVCTSSSRHFNWCFRILRGTPQDWAIFLLFVSLLAFSCPLLQWLRCVFLLYHIQTNLSQGSKQSNDKHYHKRWARGNRRHCLQHSQWLPLIILPAFVISIFHSKCFPRCQIKQDHVQTCPRDTFTFAHVSQASQCVLNRFSICTSDLPKTF